MTLKDFAIPFGLVTVLLWIYLFRASAPVLISAFLASVIATIAMYRNEDIVQMVFEPKRVLIEMKQVERNVFVKAEEVRKTAEYVGELTAFNIAHLWRVAPENPEAVRLQERDRLAQMLRAIGSSEERIRQITDRITDMVTWDLASEVWRAVPRESVSSAARAKGRDLEEIRREFVDRLTKSTVGQAAAGARQYLEPLGGWTPDVARKVEELEEFIRSGRLPERREEWGIGALR